MLSRVDRGDLLVALHSVADDPPFATFLRRLRRRLGAATVFIVERGDRSGDRRWEAGDGAQALPMATLVPLRRDRLYGDADLGLAIAGRVVRTANSFGDQWLCALGGDGFTPADGALLADLADHVALACENRMRLALARRDLVAADAALARGSIGWAVLARDGEMLAGVTPPASRRQRAELALAVGRGAALAAVGGTVATPMSDAATTLATFRVAGAPIDRAAVFAAAHGVPAREARLAVALAETGSLVAAATRLGITPKTARFYAKVLYQALDLSGQADLVRLVWTGPAALG